MFRIIRYLCLLILFPLYTNATASITFEVNKIAALFAQVITEKTINQELFDELKDLFATNSENLESEKAEFVHCLIKKKTEHKYITGKFISIWDKALLEYDSIFSRNEDILNDRKFELQAYYKQLVSGTLSDFKKVFKFYKSELSQNSLFTVYIYPTELIGSFAERYGDIIILRFNYGKKTSDICLVLRKICNRLFSTMSQGDRQSVENYFLKHPSRQSIAAYFLMDKILAYTVGEIWAHSKLMDQSDSPRQLLENEKLNKISLALFPLVQKYLKSGTPLDNNFYNSYIKIFEQQYPEANANYDIILSKASLIVENGIDVSKCVTLLKDKFPIKQLTFKASAFSTIFIGNNLGDPPLSTIQSKIPNKKNDFLFITQDDKGKLFILIKSNDDKNIEKAISIIREQKEIPLNFTEDL